MADEDWRVTVALSDETNVQQTVQSVREHEVADDVRQRLGDRVAVSADGPNIFLYATTEAAAREADRVVRDILKQRQVSADSTIDRWHPVEQEWEAATVPLPDTDAAVQAEHQHRIAEETQESLETGQAGWEVRVELPSHRDAVELTTRLRGQGYPVARRWKYLVAGANNEDQAAALAREIETEVPGSVSVHSGAAPFVHFGLSPSGIEFVPQA